ncbi:FxSxx-COOH system tetratricopeptide repeat protein [Pseudofrankia sp. BMG5.37]|uniref:FxSxx-COOH system tetratricopeptide repeat protein n=1 Tax=Pseudofrankia sp. BMG5.37 TaxID=3050035 RepID=UPI002894C8A1|nr:FxSxx-COOH system tetratricopeptide repeat protein [Pseudofrankia sp. BMG5.37]MDT3440356.1 FxSxx-COOH system tetratricopeptide repeat protein [Pseudofrankia sp. BMG5.37]
MSYTGADEAWATWVAEALERTGKTVTVQVWDSPAGANFVVWINDQMAAAGRTVAICSPAYFDSHWCTQEWTGALAGMKLIPLRVADCPMPPVLATVSYRDLHGVDEDTARRRLLEATGLAKTTRVSTGFPGAAPTSGGGAGGTPFPGRHPAIFNVPPRLRYFTGRQDLLDRLRAGLAEGSPVAITALRGLGGVGKTQLAIEYAHRHAAAFDLVWWVEAEQAALVGERLADLADRLDLPTTGRMPDDADAVLDALRRRERWLLVFDNAEDPDALRPWLPGGPGQVIVTSRNPAWGGLAAPLDVNVPPRDEAVALLARRVPDIHPEAADALAAELGDLPLALEQAAAYLETTGVSPADYLTKFRARRPEMLGRGRDLAYGGNLDTVWSLALDRLRTQAPAAVTLLDICAHLGPEPIPLALFRRPVRHQRWTRRKPAAAPEDLDDTVGAVLLYSLARRFGDTIALHRLVAAVIRAHQPPDRHEKAAATARELLVAHRPAYYVVDPAGWPVWAELAPQVLTAPALHPNDAGADIGSEARELLAEAGMYLYTRGDFRAAHTLTAALHQQWTTILGSDHPDTLTSASALTNALLLLGDYQAARTLAEDILARCRRMVGDDDPATLSSAHSVAFALYLLGDYRAARDLDEDTLTRWRRVLGDDNPNTLLTANNLAADLCELGEHQAARTLAEDTLARYRRVLDDDHPHTLDSAINLAAALHQLGEYQAARELNKDTLTRLRRLLGNDHYDTLRTAINLAADLRKLGEYQAARELNEDTLARYRRTFGDDHPFTLRSANNLAADLHALGDHQAARTLDEDTLARYRRVLDDDHPHTLDSMNNLAADLRELGEHQAARTLDEDTLTRRRRILGNDHPDTLRSANNLARDLRLLGDHQAAREWEEFVRR